jgi:glycosyltransferase involved in cell wall biosynthesis
MTDLSYLVSCFNSDQFLDGLIENLLQQHEEDFEIIIVDSASTDNSVEIAQCWMARDKRVKLIQQKERTPYGVSWLEGWRAAEGAVVGNSNTDDRSYQWRGTKVIQAYRARYITRVVKPLAFFYGGYETRVDGIKTAKGTPPPFSVDDMSRLFRCGVHVHWERNIAAMADWDMMFKAAHEYKSAFDYWLVLYFMSLGVEGVPIQSCFSIYNQRPDSLEQIDKERNTFESIRAIRTFFPDGPVARDMEEKTRVESPGFYQRYQEFLHEFD